MKVRACNVNTGITTVISDATSYFIFFLSNYFPKDYFKRFIVAGSLAALKYEGKEDVIKQEEYPTLLINPIYTAEDGILEELPAWHYTNNYIFNNTKQSRMYNRVLHDDYNKIYIHSVPNRIKINFECKIITGTKLSAYNILHYLKQKFEVGGYRYINDIDLETLIPDYYIKVISNYLKLDLNDFEQKDQFEGYLLQHSYNGISEKRNCSTGNMNYGYKYPVNILFNFPDLPSIDKENNNNVEEKNTISFNASFEFWSQSNYILEMPSDENIDYDDIPFEEIMADGTYRFDIPIPVQFIDKQIGRFHLLYNRKFVCNMNETVETLKFKSVLSDELQTVLEYLNNKKEDMKKYVKIRIVCNRKLMSQNEYKLDWKNYEIKLDNPLSNANFRFLFYGDLKLLNGLNNSLIDKNITKI